jgi:hypothetical protein
MNVKRWLGQKGEDDERVIWSKYIICVYKNELKKSIKIAQEGGRKNNRTAKHNQDKLYRWMEI